MIHSIKKVLLPRRRLVAEWCNKNVVENRHRKRLFLLRTCFPTPYITHFDPVRTSERSLFWKLTWGPVRIVEDLPYGFALGRLREPDHVVRRTDLHKREPRLQIFGGYENFATKSDEKHPEREMKNHLLCQGGGQRGFPRVGGALEQDADLERLWK